MTLFGTALIFCAILFNQKFYKLLPTLITLVVMLFNSRANRFGFLLGGINCIIYAVGYLSENLYGAIFSTVFNAILSFVSFFRWKKRSYGKATVFIKMKSSVRIIGVISILVCYGIITFVMSKTDNKYFYVDSMTMLLGFVIPILTMSGYLEYIPLQIINLILNLTTWIIISSYNVANITYIISVLYNCYMSIRQFIRWINLYKEQHAPAI